MTNPMPDRLTEILDGLQARLEGGLRGNRSAVTHPGARGEASDPDPPQERVIHPLPIRPDDETDHEQRELHRGPPPECHSPLTRDATA